MGQIYHITRRGARGTPIVKDSRDRDLFLARLYYFNHREKPINWKRTVGELIDTKEFSWPDKWTPRNPKVDIYAYFLHDNHFHLLLEEKNDGDASSFLHDIVLSMSHHFNKKYGEKGTLFQHDSINRYITDDEYLLNTNIYIQVKNAMELFPNSLKGAISNFDNAFSFASGYKYCSLKSYVNGFHDVILTKDILSPHFEGINDYKDIAKEQIERYIDHLDEGKNEEEFLLELGSNRG